MAEELLTTVEVVKKLKVSRQTLNKWRDEGLPHMKLSNRVYRYQFSEVLEWLQARNVREGSKGTEAAKKIVGEG